MLISTAYAQGVGGLFDSSNAMVQFLPLVLIFVVFYFLLIRPQQKKQKDHRGMLDALRRGDRVVTGGGIIGTVNRVISAEEVEVDIASGTRVRVVRSTITNVLAKPDPGAAREAAAAKEPRRRGSARAAVAAADEPAANDAGEKADEKTPQS
ncbi:MAG TPA: preprotein translocase subunit YajC [Stellaceae bacterium]|jgi:preprotein translocase subunit YajC